MIIVVVVDVDAATRTKLECTNPIGDPPHPSTSTLLHCCQPRLPSTIIIILKSACMRRIPHKNEMKQQNLSDWMKQIHIYVCTILCLGHITSSQFELQRCDDKFGLRIWRWRRAICSHNNTSSWITSSNFVAAIESIIGAIRPYTNMLMKYRIFSLMRVHDFFQRELAFLRKKNGERLVSSIDVFVISASPIVNVTCDMSIFFLLARRQNVRKELEKFKFGEEKKVWASIDG